MPTESQQKWQWVLVLTTANLYRTKLGWPINQYKIWGQLWVQTLVLDIFKGQVRKKSLCICFISDMDQYIAFMGAILFQAKEVKSIDHFGRHVSACITIYISCVMDMKQVSYWYSLNFFKNWYERVNIWKNYSDPNEPAALLSSTCSSPIYEVYQIKLNSLSDLKETDSSNSGTFYWDFENSNSVHCVSALWIESTQLIQSESKFWTRTTT